jgi:hypothetical protein
VRFHLAPGANDAIHVADLHALVCTRVDVNEIILRVHECFLLFDGTDDLPARVDRRSLYVARAIQIVTLGNAHGSVRRWGYGRQNNAALLLRETDCGKYSDGCEDGRSNSFANDLKSHDFLLFTSAE